MLRYYTVFFALLGFNSYSQTFYNGFEEGSIEGWSQTDGTSNLLGVSNDVYNYLTLQSKSDSQELALSNRDYDYWAGNYFLETSEGEVLRTVDDIIIKNTNDFDLHLRYGFKGANGYEVITTNPIVIKANSDWEAYSNFYYAFFDEEVLDNLTIINNTGDQPWNEVMQSIHELFEDVVEFKIFHNPEVSFEGSKQKGTLMMESVVSWEQSEAPVKDLPKLSIFPNPFVDQLQITSNEVINALKIYNTQGSLVFDRNINNRTQNVDVSFLNSGVYMFEVEFINGTVLSKKLVKQ